MSRPLVIFAAVAVLLVPGCAYRTGTLMPGGVRKVAVQMFANETRFRRVELTYTRVLTKELVERSYVSLRDPQDAEAIIRGRIVSIVRRPLIEGRLDDVLESSVVPVVEVEMVDARTGAPLIEPFLITSRRAENILPRGETLQDALDEVMEELAQQTVVRIEALSFLDVPFPGAEESTAPLGESAPSRDRDPLAELEPAGGEAGADLTEPGVRAPAAEDPSLLPPVSAESPEGSR